MEVREGYKLTEVGVIPERWEVSKLQNYVAITSGDSPSKFIFKKSGVPYYKVEQLNNTNKYLKNHTPYFIDTKQKVVQSSVIFPKRGAAIFLNKIRLLKEDAFFDTNLMALTIHSNELLAEYLFYILNFKGLDQIADTTSVPQINNKHINPFIIPIPPKPEQQAIAQALSDTDALIDSLEKLIEKKRHIKQGAMQELLTGKRRLPGFEMKQGYKQTELGEIPEDWEVVTIENVCTVSTGSKNTQDRVENGKYPFFVRSQTIERINSYTYDEEAVLTAGDGVGTGKVFHYINGKFDVHQRVYVMTDFHLTNGYFFYLYFSNNFYDRISQMTAKSSVDSVRKEMIADMLMPIPNKEEQQAIATVLSDMDTEIEALENKLQKTREIKDGMMHELLTGRIRLI